jgi:mono/diheme cytochrome c family protein
MTAPTGCGAVLGAALCFAALSVTSALRAAEPVEAGPAAASPDSKAASPDSKAASTPAGVTNVQLAWQNWVLNCQGCHRLDGSGSDATAPSLAGTVAKFLWVPGGREYLARVPGVSTSPLSDADLAEVMNWMLWRYDREHLPSNFRPFTAAEIGPLRSRPLRLEAAGMRRDLLSKAEASGQP